MCACQRMQGAWNPFIRLANRSTPSPQFGIVVFEQMNCSNARCLIEPAPARFCHRGDAPAPSGRGLSLSRASLASLNAFLFLPAFARHCASCPRPSTAPAAADSEAGRRAGDARPEGKNAGMTGRSLLQTRQRKFFPAAGGRQVARAAPCFHSIDFYVTAQPSLVLSLYAPRYCLTASAGFGRQFTKLRALSRLRRRYGSKKVPFSSSSSYIFSANSASAAATAWRRISPRSPAKRCSRARTPSGPA